MLAGAGDTIIVFDAVTPVTDTVCSLELHPADVNVAVVVVDDDGVAQSYHPAVFVNTWFVLPAEVGVNSDTVTAPVCPLTDVTAQLSASHQYQFAVFFNTYQVVAVPHGLNSDTVTAHVLPFTLDTGNAIEVSVIHVTCPRVLVVIVGTFVEVHLVV